LPEQGGAGDIHQNQTKTVSDSWNAAAHRQQEREEWESCERPWAFDSVSAIASIGQASETRIPRLARCDFWSTDAQVNFPVGERVQDSLHRLAREALGTAKGAKNSEGQAGRAGRKTTGQDPPGGPNANGSLAVQPVVIGSKAEQEGQSCCTSRSEMLVPLARSAVPTLEEPFGVAGSVNSLVCSPKSCMQIEDAKPFDWDVQLLFDHSHVNVSKHPCKRPSRMTRNLVIFCPGIFGGLGPGCGPGEIQDSRCIFISCARKLAKSRYADFDCYRLSWAQARPGMDAATGAVHQVLRYAIKTATACDNPPHEYCAFFVGHSFGSLSAMVAADLAVQQFSSGTQPQQPPLHVAGVCTLNSEYRHQLSCRHLECASALFIAGRDDEIVTPAATVMLKNEMPMRSTKMVILPGGSHGLYEHRDRVVSEISQFILKNALGQVHYCKRF